MKPIIMNMREMSLSKEVYDKKPGKFFTLFIYGLFVLVATALAWAYFGKIDIVIRAQGIIRPNAQVAVVINAVQGEVQYVHFYEGMYVQQGDVLYVMDTFHLENEREMLAVQLSSLELELATFELFHDSLLAGENLINSFNYEHSTRFDSFLLSLGAIEHDAQHRINLLQEEAQSLAAVLARSNTELGQLRAFENSILQERDMFGGNSAQRSQYLRYVLEMEDFAFQIQAATATLEGYRMIHESVLAGESIFLYAGIYRSIFDEHILQISQLTASYELAYEDYSVTSALAVAGIVPLVDVTIAAARLENIRATIYEADANFLLGIDNAIRNTENRITQLTSQKEILHVSTLAGIRSQISNIEIEILSMTRAKNQAALQQNANFFVGEEVGDVAMLRLGEINRTLGQISTIEQTLDRLAISIEGIDALISESTVRAPMCGVVAIQTQLTEGGFIPGGVHVISIMPMREGTLNANIFVSNNDIGRIQEGMTVRYDIAAMPRRDFGDILGTVSRISTDISTEDGVAGFFLVESAIEDRMYYDARGNGAQLRVGMAFEVRIVVEQQRVLFYLLDRLNLR